MFYLKVKDIKSVIQKKQNEYIVAGHNGMVGSAIEETPK